MTFIYSNLFILNYKVHLQFVFKLVAEIFEKVLYCFYFFEICTLIVREFSGLSGGSNFVIINIKQAQARVQTGFRSTDAVRQAAIIILGYFSPSPPRPFVRRRSNQCA